MHYTQELLAIQNAGIKRTREIFPSEYLDFASNDYLGLSFNKNSLKKAYNIIRKPKNNAPRASMLVNGYSKLHKKLESKLANINNFQNCILVGSGFLANIAIIESLVRKKDMIFIDEYYHTSGILASKLVKNTTFFKHNDGIDLEKKIIEFISNKSNASTNNTSKNNTSTSETSKSGNSRIIIAIEGIYSMSGDIAKKDFASIALKYNAILIVDEAHSSGVLGDNLLGFFDFYHIKIHPNFIKLGTFSKAYGSYGAYILSSNHIYQYLQTRAKPIIYSTALSAFDSALALVNLKFIHRNRHRFRKKINCFKKIIFKKLKIKLDSQIFSIQFQNQNEMLEVAKCIKSHKILVGAIRKPSVEVPQLRIILSIKHTKKDIFYLCSLLKRILKK